MYIHSASLDWFGTIGIFSNFLLWLFSNIFKIFIIFVIAYYILIKLFNIRGDDR